MHARVVAGRVVVVPPPATARSPFLNELTVLDLTHNFFGDEGEDEAIEELESRFGRRASVSEVRREG